MWSNRNERWGEGLTPHLRMGPPGAGELVGEVPFFFNFCGRRRCGGRPEPPKADLPSAEPLWRPPQRQQPQKLIEKKSKEFRNAVSIFCKTLLGRRWWKRSKALAKRNRLMAGLAEHRVFHLCMKY